MVASGGAIGLAVICYGGVGFESHFDYAQCRSQPTGTTPLTTMSNRGSDNEPPPPIVPSPSPNQNYMPIIM